jgi:hypothetical protein
MVSISTSSPQAVRAITLRAELLDQLSLNKPEAQILKWLAPHLPEVKTWLGQDLNETDQILLSACNKGKAKLYRRLFHELNVPAGLAGNHFPAACLSESSAMIRTVLASSQGAQLMDVEQAIGFIFDTRQPQLNAMIRTLFADERLCTDTCFTALFSLHVDELTAQR